MTLVHCRQHAVHDTDDLGLHRVKWTVGRLEYWKEVVLADVLEILASATLSSILETKLRFEIGRYEQESFGSNDDFFRSGRTMVCLLFTGNVDC